MTLEILELLVLFLYQNMSWTAMAMYVQEDCETRLTSEKVQSVVEKYLSSIKKLTDDFPNHQIEVHLDIGGDDQIPRTPHRRFNYIHLRKPMQVIGRQKQGARSGRANDTAVETSLRPTPLASSGLPDMQPVYVKDLKKAIEELERKYEKQIRKHKDDAAEGKLHKTDKTIADDNIRDIMRLLEKGTLVGRNIQEPTEENMNWLQIKIPNK